MSPCDEERHDEAQSQEDCVECKTDETEFAIGL